MKPEDMSVLEPNAPPRFVKRQLLAAHVEKHVFRQWSQEKWKNVLGLDPQVTADARRHWLQGRRTTPAVKQVLDAYESVCGRTVLRLSEQGRGHCHLVRYGLPGDRGAWLAVSGRVMNATSQRIVAWDDRKLMFLVATAPVRNNRLMPYHLKTGYRVAGSTDRGRLRAKARLWVDTMIEFKQQRMLADHGGRK